MKTPKIGKQTRLTWREYSLWTYFNITTSSLTSPLAVRLLAGPHPRCLAHPLLWPDNLVAHVAGVDGTVTKVPPCLVYLTVIRVQ